MRASALAGALLLAGCSHRPAPPAASAVHYQIGAPYQLGGAWSYPRESFQQDDTGLAVALPDREGPTADGEAFDPAAMAGAHRTLQLPAIARVTNLENGRQIELRLNDRGPVQAGRLLGVTRRAASLLGVPPAGAAQIRLEIERGSSEALRDQFHAGPQGVTAAPVQAVRAETLPPPGGRATRSATISSQNPGPQAEAIPAVPDHLPETVVQTEPHPGQLWIRAGRFTGSSTANLVRSKLSGLPVDVRREGGQRATEYIVMVGPFAGIDAADIALDQAWAAGVTDAAIVVE